MRCWDMLLIQSDSLARGPKLVYRQIFNKFVNQLTVDVLTTRYYQQDGATVTLQMRACEKLKVFLKIELSQKTFGHPDLPI